jgi:acyl-CoA synthetase (NDP forming)
MQLDAIFHPKTVAIIGASMVGDMATPAHLNTKLRDRLYLVNPKYKEIYGRGCYPSLLDIEGPVDYVIVIVNANSVPRVIEDCVQKGVKAAHIYTAGFSETGLPENIELEEQIKRLAAGRMRLIGPNCFGIYCPESGLAIIPESTENEGGVGVISQSGSVAESFSYFGKTKNIQFSKVISYGNAVDLDCPDFLEYLADDPSTKVIGLYIEGSKNGSLLKKALAYAAGKKPVIAIKGGLSDNGNRVARSHTGQMTGAPKLWKSLFAQCGVIQVKNNEELMNAALAFSHSPLPKGNRIAMIANSGGFSVIQTDLSVSAGLDAPPFTGVTIQKLRESVPLAGTIISNPLDAWPIFYKVAREQGSLVDIIKAVGSDEHVDSLVYMFDQFRYIRRGLKGKAADHMKVVIELMLEASNYCRDVLGKPVFLNASIDPFLEDEEDRDNNLALKRAFEKANYPVYASSQAAVLALASLYRYARIKGIAMERLPGQL